MAGMTRGLFKDPERYLEVYWSRWPDVWVHGDWASIEDGRWYLHGRSDDTIKIAGKRSGPPRPSRRSSRIPPCSKRRPVGMPNELKGEELWAYVVLAPGHTASEALRAELVDAVTSALGKSFKPAGIRFVSRRCRRRAAPRCCDARSDRPRWLRPWRPVVARGPVVDRRDQSRVVRVMS